MLLAFPIKQSADTRGTNVPMERSYRYTVRLQMMAKIAILTI